MTVLSVFLYEMILLLHGCEAEIDLLVRVFNLVVTVVQFVIFNLESHKLLLDSEIIL
jgi:hypothetical protein